LPFLADTPPPCSHRAASKGQEHQHQHHTLPMVEMSDGARAPLVITVCKCARRRERRFGAWAMAKQLLNDG
jgi:hypothetical protein